MVTPVIVASVCALPGEDGEHLWWGPDVPGCRDMDSARFHTALRNAGELCASVFADRVRASATGADGAHVLGINLYVDTTLVT